MNPVLESEFSNGSLCVWPSATSGSSLVIPPDGPWTAAVSPGCYSCTQLPLAFVLLVPSAQNAFPPDTGLAHFLAILKSLLNYHPVDEAFLDLSITLSSTAQIPVLAMPLYFPMQLSAFELATYCTVSPH